jgi:DNA-binding response OmpR family regulator
MARMMHIMVVDDEETICVALSAWLTKEGYTVETAPRGRRPWPGWKEAVRPVPGGF